MTSWTHRRAAEIAAAVQLLVRPGSSNAQDPLNRASPQSSVNSFLEACRSKDYDRAWRYLDLRNLRPEQRLKQGPELAQELFRVLENNAQFDVAALSREPEGERPEPVLQT
jgi:hypothetical protein